jgi:tRNA-specific 2-thiouridylase
MIGKRQKKILLGMSGGLDSSVAAALLVEKGYRVTGVTMKTWTGGDMPVRARHGCYGPGEEEDIADAAKVARKLGMGYRVIDLSSEFKTEVLDYFCREYRSGRTPSPCLVCNSRIKFGRLWSAAVESGIQFDYFATGHYARCERDSHTGRYLLKKGLDRRKDQSYFLAFLKQEQLSRIMFPLGGRTKTEVRAIAADPGLEIRDKPESQDFIGFDYHTLLEDMPPGPITDAGGKRLGTHQGLGLYTVGQRKGLELSGGPYYVTGIDAATNTVIVGRKEDLLGNRLVISHLNWIAVEKPAALMKLNVKIRYQHAGAEAEIVPLGPDSAEARFTSPQSAIAPGQAAVFYDGATVIGAGIIES